MIIRTKKEVVMIENHAAWWKRVGKIVGARLHSFTNLHQATFIFEFGTMSVFDSEKAHSIQEYAVSVDGNIGAVLLDLNDKVEQLQTYADKLAEGLPVGMLPKDIENLNEANMKMATEIEQLKKKLYKCNTEHENNEPEEGDEFELPCHDFCTETLTMIMGNTSMGYAYLKDNENVRIDLRNQVWYCKKHDDNIS